MSRFSEQFSALDASRKAMYTAYRCEEPVHVKHLLNVTDRLAKHMPQIRQQARHLVEQIRENQHKESGFSELLNRYDLSSEEGIALMCLAEAMLRVPDKHTITDLIRDKLSDLAWKNDEDQEKNSFFTNAATWGLVVTGNLLKPDEDEQQEQHFSGVLRKLVGRVGEPVIRKAVAQAMKLLGQQFVMGKDMKSAIKRARDLEAKNYRYSYDMLGEAAHTAADAERYFVAYQDAIKALVNPEDRRPLLFRPGISIKLSALHPRYETAHQAACVPVLTERLRSLVWQAREANITVTVDAEEADRLDISLDIFKHVFCDKALEGWEGLGLVVQAYQKRALPMIDWLTELARGEGRRILVRLVKGAYWDTEIKDTQVRGLGGYPVMTRKQSTDVSYTACVQALHAAKDAIFPQFATHNALTVATVLHIMGDDKDYEFQCLHGMGAMLYRTLLERSDGSPGVFCRIYAPVGKYEDLLPYLVRRLLENGANSSFVNRIVDDKVSIEDVIADPIKAVHAAGTGPHPSIPLPRDIFGDSRPNSKGLDLNDKSVLLATAKSMDKALDRSDLWCAGPLVEGKAAKSNATVQVTNPADRRVELSAYHPCNAKQVQEAVIAAEEAFFTWDGLGVTTRADFLRKAADLLERRAPEFMAIMVKEAGKVWGDAIDEVREAVDFLRYYASEAEEKLATQRMPGPTGETNDLSMHGRGVMLCISPWNFPLAIFIGQVSAALVAGNTVLAKPASQTVIVARAMVDLMYEAGIPRGVLQLLPGKRDVVGQPLLTDERVAGVMVTGSTATAKAIQRTLAERSGPIVPLVAETGGQNVMIVDSTALPEQIVQDVVDSAFRSAGQRCSALRVLYIQEDVADKVLQMLKGAMQELVMGDPTLIATDVGPVIDTAALNALQKHQAYLNTIGEKIYQLPFEAEHQHGTFFAPCAYKIDSLSQLKDEVFGPILHIITYKRKDLDQVIEDINATGYGLTLGVHSRISTFAEYIRRRVCVGNMYVNRNMIGAVVGVQPFGGEGLSGTGPKAGGPHYLLRLVKERTVTINTTAVGGNASLLAEGG